MSDDSTQGSVATITAHTSVKLQASMRINMGAPHLLSAAIHARRLAEIEEEHRGEPFGAFWDDILASASAAIFCSVAGLESYANELFASRTRLFPAMPIPALGMVWESFERASILDKFQLALVLRSKQKLNRGDIAWQEAALLIELRNALTHFKPEWSDEADRHDKLSRRLASTLAPSMFLPGEVLFPRSWASASTAEWSVSAVVRFVQAFEVAAGIESRIAPYLTRLRFAERAGSAGA